MNRRPPRYTRTDTLFPYTTRFRARPTATKSVFRVIGNARNARLNSPPPSTCPKKITASVRITRSISSRGKRHVSPSAQFFARAAADHRTGLRTDRPDAARGYADDHAARDDRGYAVAGTHRHRYPAARHRVGTDRRGAAHRQRSEEHTSELQSLMRISYAVFCLKKKKTNKSQTNLHSDNTRNA